LSSATQPPESLPTEPLTEDTPALKKFRTEWLRPAPARGLRGTVYEVRDPVEKPDPRDAPSDLANIGRYVLTPDLFLILEDTPPDSRGEIRLTNGLRVLREGSLNPALLWKLTSPGDQSPEPDQT
jgi:hypothetical protein